MMMPLISQYTEALAGSKDRKLKILEIAAGSGEPSLSLAKELPNSEIMLTYLAPQMVAQAESRAKAQDVTNIRWLLARCARMLQSIRP